MSEKLAKLADAAKICPNLTHSLDISIVIYLHSFVNFSLPAFDRKIQENMRAFHKFNLARGKVRERGRRAFCMPAGANGALGTWGRRSRKIA
jgi:hypothetical protein